MKEYLQIFLKRMAVAIFGLMLALMCICFAQKNSSVVFAAEDTETVSSPYMGGDGYISERCEDISSYIGEKKAPIATTLGYEDWLFAGWYSDAECTNEAVIKSGTGAGWAKFVPADILSVKLQLKTGTTSNGGPTNMRLVSSVDSLNYKEVGFYVYYNGSENPVHVKSTTVYESIVASYESGVEYNYNPKIINVESDYFVTATLINIADTNFDKTFYIQPYWTTLDGTTVYGVNRFITVDNGISTTNVNLTVKVDSAFTEGTTVELTNAATASAETPVKYTATVAKYEAPYVYLNMTVDNRDSALLSLTRFTMDDGSATVSADWRNLKTTHVVTGSTTSINSDTSWYDVDSSKEKFVITTSADLYGLSQIVNASTSTATRFSGKTIYLGADITVNELEEGETASDFKTKATDDDATNDPYEWIPIAPVWSYRFMGTFDGCGKAISGIYLVDDEYNSSTEQYYGLFGTTAEGSTVRNFSLLGSYFENTSNGGSKTPVVANIGSIIGQMGGSADTIYSDAVVVSTNPKVGGIIARTNPGNSTGTCSIDNCWFAGSITVTQDSYDGSRAMFIGGIVGQKIQATLNVTNCLMTGSVVYSCESVAEGLTDKIPYISALSGNATTTSYCVNAGTVNFDSIANCVDSDKHNNLTNATTKTNNFWITSSGMTNYNGYKGYQKMSETVVGASKGLTFYDSSDKNSTGKWVCRETASDVNKGYPVLKSFCDKWIDVSWYLDNTTLSDYTIVTAEEFYGFSELTYVYSQTFSGKTVSLGKNIKLNTGDASLWADGTYAPERTFNTIGGGTETTAFAGIFDGQGKEISGLYINKDAYNTGLFGYVNGGTVKNFKLTNSYVKNIKVNTGSVVGKAINATIENVYSDAYVKSTQNTVAGIVGNITNSGDTTDISRCWYAGEVTQTGNKQYVGGIIGRIEAGTVNVSDCLFTGIASSARTSTEAFAGGILGGVSASSGTFKTYITKCVSNGEVIATQTATAATGGVVGGHTGKSSATVELYIEDVYDTTTLTSDAGNTFEMSAAGLGAPCYGTISKLYGIPMSYTDGYLNGSDAYKYTKLTFCGSSEDQNKTGAWVATDNGPELYTFSETKTTSTFEGVAKAETDWYYNEFDYVSGAQVAREYVIHDANDFRGMAPIVNNQVDNFSGKIVTVDPETKVINLSEGWTVDATVTEASVEVKTSGNANVWESIGLSSTVCFDGTFDGNMATITGLYVNRISDFAGLFGRAGENSTIKSLTLDNSYIKSTGKYTGAVVAGTSGNVEEIYSNAIVESTGSYVGGIAGFSTSSSVKTISNCWFGGVVKASNQYVGGIVGLVWEGTKTIENCLNTGSVINTLSSKATYTGGIAGAVSGTNAGLTTYIKTSINDGYVYSAHCDGAGSVVGYSKSANKPTTIYMEDVYTTRDVVTKTALTDDKKAATITGFGTNSLKTALVYGTPVQYGSDKISDKGAYIYTELDFWSEDNPNGAWVAIEDGTPELKNFSSKTAISSFDGVERISTSWYYNEMDYATSNTSTSSTTEFEIATADELRGLGEIVNTAVDEFELKTVTLKEDIVLNNATKGTEAKEWAKARTNGEAVDATSWVPIGTVDGVEAKNPFRGTFDGDNHTISGLYLSSSDSYIGLFGRIHDATICNLRLENSYLRSEVSAGNYSLMGSIAGGGDGIIENVYSNAILYGSKWFGGLVGAARRESTTTTTELYVTSSWFDGVMDSNYKGSGRVYIGGVVGYPVHGTTVIDTCLYTGTINFNVTYNGTNTDEESYGPQIGGICSGDDISSDVKVLNCVSSGEINATMSKSTNNPSFTLVGSILGQARDTSTTIANSYALTTMNDTKESSGKTTTRTSAYYDSDYKQSTEGIDKSFMGAPDTMYGYGAQLWTDLSFTGEGPIWAALAGELPVPATLADNALEMIVGKPDTDLSGTGTEQDPYLITSVEELAGFAKLSKSKTFAGEYVALGNDIIINAGESAEKWADGTAMPTLPWYEFIGVSSNGKRFEGTFDGKNPETGEVHTISGIWMERNTTSLGLFSATEAGSAIKNLRLENSYIAQLGNDISKTWNTGSIVGDCRGTIDNVYSNAIVTTAVNELGGIAGRINGYSYTNHEAEIESRISSTVSNCWYDGTLKATGESRYVGGITGVVTQGQWKMENCLFTGTIHQEYPGDSHAYLGGLCGRISSPSSTETSEMQSKLTVESCVSAGTIHTSNGGYGAGAVVGRVVADVLFTTTEDEAGNVISKEYKESVASELEMNNVFATRESGAQDVGNANTVKETDLEEQEYAVTPTTSGYVVWVSNTDRLIGYCKEDTTDDYAGANLDFTSSAPTWIIRSKGTSVPSTFADIVTKVDVSTLDVAIGLDKWTSFDSSASIKNAIHQGAGKYVLTLGSSTSDSKDTYETYIEHLTTSVADGGLGFTAYASTSDTAVYNTIFTKEDGDWVLNVLHTDNTGVTSITIQTGIDKVLSPNLLSSGTTAALTENVSLSMLQLTGSSENLSSSLLDGYYYGNSFVITLKYDGDGDGTAETHFIIDDGGNVGDYKGLMNYLKTIAGTVITTDEETGAIVSVKNPVRIDAWIVSHQHNDHFGVVKGFLSNKNDVQAVTVEAFYINEPNNRAIDYIYPSTAQGTNLENQYRGVRMLKTADGDSTPIYNYQTGQRFYFNGVTMDVVQSQEVLSVADYGKRNAVGAAGTDYNTTSSNIVLTIGSGDSAYKVFITGDSNYVNMKYMMNAYGSDENKYTTSALLSGIDVYQAMHHGKNTSYVISGGSEAEINTFTNYLTKGGTATFDTVLFPASVIYGYSGNHDNGAFPRAKAANTYLISCTKDGVERCHHYGDGTKVVTFGESIEVTTSKIDTTGSETEVGED